MLNDLNNRAFAWLMAGCMCTILGLVVLMRFWSDLGKAGPYLKWALLASVAGLVLYCVHRFWHDFSSRRLQRKQVAETIRRENAAQEHQQWVESQQLLHAQELERDRLQLERDRLALDREKFHVTMQLDHRRVLVPEGHTVVFSEPGGGYTPIQSARPGTQAQIERTGKDDKGSREQVSPPTQEEVLAQLKPNMLQVSPGVRASNGQVVKVSIVEIPHLKFIGSSGFGKSCLAAAVINQATTLNTPALLQIALLDLEHKTSRLFENLPHVGEVTVGRRRVSLVATNADEVAEHLGHLKRELDRRARMSEDDLNRQPCLLMYVEEMLSLQYEVVDPKLLDRMLADLTILAVRGRKYGMFLLCVAQVDYSTEELRIAQKQFRFRAAAAVDTTAARAAGFMNTELVKENFSNGQPGQFVVEYPGFSDIVLAPRYDIKKLLNAPTSADFTTISEVHTPPEIQLVKPLRNTLEKNDETAWQAKVQAVAEYRFQGWGKVAIVEKVWRVKAGATLAYKTACAEYDTILAQLIAEQEREAL